ncbi:MAG: hypothetical protein M3Z37_10780 [Candidatus Eremiobacteraeota bacterium]|nr:hypothetical protein [Candidatus Eremiobacteraeota bacterium]
MKVGFEFGTVYVKDASFGSVEDALIELMTESDRLPTQERGLEPTPDSSIAAKRVRSFAVMPQHDGWTAILEDGHPRDDGGLAEGLSDLLRAETLHLRYSDAAGEWSFVRYWEGQPLEAGGSDDADYDAAALEFVQSTALPHFGVYYEEVAAALGGDTPALAGSLSVVGEIVPNVPAGTEVFTFQRPGKPLPH